MGAPYEPASNPHEAENEAMRAYYEHRARQRAKERYGVRWRITWGGTWLPEFILKEKR